MKMVARIAALGLLVAGGLAVAAPNDFRIYQLGNPTFGGAGYDRSANANFRIFANELGAALSSINLMPPSTLGYNGFALSGELSVINFKSTQFALPTESTFSGPLLMPSLHIRKGLPFSFEVGARGGWLEKSRMGVATIEGKWALNEGFTYFPDLGVRGHFSRLFNTRDFDLLATGIDVGLGKRFAIAGMFTLTPYVGWNLIWVGAYSNNVDFNPGRSYQDSVRTPTAQLQDTAVYDEVKLGSNSHNRFYGGLRFIGGVVQIGAEISYSSFHQIRDDGIGANRSMPSLLVLNTSLGLDF
jgi:hypothetical protein